MGEEKPEQPEPDPFTGCDESAPTNRRCERCKLSGQSEGQPKDRPVYVRCTVGVLEFFLCLGCASGAAYRLLGAGPAENEDAEPGLFEGFSPPSAPPAPIEQLSPYVHPARRRALAACARARIADGRDVPSHMAAALLPAAPPPRAPQLATAALASVQPRAARPSAQPTNAAPTRIAPSAAVPVPIVIQGGAPGEAQSFSTQTPDGMFRVDFKVHEPGEEGTP